MAGLDSVRHQHRRDARFGGCGVSCCFTAGFADACSTARFDRARPATAAMQHPAAGWVCAQRLPHPERAGRGEHGVRTVISRRFLDYTRAQGNDLITPNPAQRFPGLKQGDRWCVRRALAAGA